MMMRTFILTFACIVLGSTAHELTFSFDEWFAAEWDVTSFKVDLKTGSIVDDDITWRYSIGKASEGMQGKICLTGDR